MSESYEHVLSLSLIVGESDVSSVDHPFEELKHAYQVLGVPTDASEPAIKRAHRELLMRWHPDHYTPGTPDHDEATKMASMINEAYEAIADAPLRDQPRVATAPRRTEPPENEYAEEWKCYRIRCNKLSWIQAACPLLWLSAIFFEPTARHMGKVPAIFVLIGMVGLGPAIMIAAEHLKTDFSCPRCHRNFFGVTFWRGPVRRRRYLSAGDYGCAYCGLPYEIERQPID
jgi:DnaJ domain